MWKLSSSTFNTNLAKDLGKSQLQIHFHTFTRRDQEILQEWQNISKNWEQRGTCDAFWVAAALVLEGWQRTQANDWRAFYRWYTQQTQDISDAAPRCSKSPIDIINMWICPQWCQAPCVLWKPHSWIMGTVFLRQVYYLNSFGELRGEFFCCNKIRRPSSALWGTVGEFCFL